MEETRVNEPRRRSGNGGGGANRKRRVDNRGPGDAANRGGNRNRSGGGRSKRRRRSRKPNEEPNGNSKNLPGPTFDPERPFRIKTAVDPTRRIQLGGKHNDKDLRVIDLITPIGFGQRGLIVAPPRSGKTVLLKKLAMAIETNHPEAELFVILIDERPEEVTDLRRSVKGKVRASCLDAGTRAHISTVEDSLEEAIKLVEEGKDVVMVMDSLTRMARAYNRSGRGCGRTLSGGLDAGAMQKPREFFGSARAFEEPGSLTILATALVDTGSKMDQVIFEEFKGTGNMELVLDRKMAEKRIFPAIDIRKSGTRKEEKLMRPDELEKYHTLRRVLVDLPPERAVSVLLDKIKQTEDNSALLDLLFAARS